MLIDRRFVLTGATGLLAGCGDKGAKVAAPSLDAAPAMLDRVIAGDWRPDADKARDAWRHPAESLAFWGLSPGMTVVEFWPGAGWYTEILAPFLQQTGGKLYAALQPADDPLDPAAEELVEVYKRKLRARRRLYGQVEFTEFGPTSGPVADPGSADLALFLRNIHNWMAAGIVEKAFADAFAALKPGGVLGVEEHRANPGDIQDILASDGYVQESLVKQIAAEAGFVFDAASEINANEADTKDYPFGVWTLAPTRLTAPRGAPPDPSFDRSQYDEIGESDRMTLRFVKPA